MVMQAIWFELSATTLLSFVTTCLVIELTPGPNMGYLALISASRGRRAGYAATAGVALGLLLVGLAAALGLAAAIEASPVLYQLLRWAGVLYLLWLAWDGWHKSGAPEADGAGDITEDATFFLRGLMTNVLNPKAALFYVAVLPGFVDQARPVIAQTVWLSVIFVLIATAIHLTIVTLAGATERFLAEPGRRVLVRRVLSVALGGIALWFAWSSRS